MFGNQQGQNAPHAHYKNWNWAPSSQDEVERKIISDQRIPPSVIDTVTFSTSHVDFVIDMTEPGHLKLKLSKGDNIYEADLLSSYTSNTLMTEKLTNPAFPTVVKDHSNTPDVLNDTMPYELDRGIICEHHHDQEEIFREIYKVTFPDNTAGTFHISNNACHKVSWKDNFSNTTTIELGRKLDDFPERAFAANGHVAGHPVAGQRVHRFHHAA